MNKDWLFTGDGFTCDLRVAGVLVKDHRMLVQRDRDGTTYALPGGHVHIGETLENALTREIREEMGVDIRCVRLLWSEECFWAWQGKQAHQISFYYLMELCEPLELPENGEFVPQKDHHDVVFGWMTIDELQHVTTYPAFLKEEIHHLNGPMKHFVSRE